jgi:predicted small lipoprotein YifL
MSTLTTGLPTRLLVLALIIAMASPLAACGRKGSPERPDDSEYPRNYPTQ